MNIFKMEASTQFLDKKRQDQILSCLYVRCATKFKAKFMETDLYKPDENAKSWPWWSSKKCTLRKIIFGKYTSNSLPISFVNAILEISSHSGALSITMLFMLLLLSIEWMSMAHPFES